MKKDPKDIKVGDRFRLLGDVWMVDHQVNSNEKNPYFMAHAGDLDFRKAMQYPLSEAHKLDWIEEPVFLSKEQAEKVKEIVREDCMGCVIHATDFEKHIDSLVREGGGE